MTVNINVISKYTKLPYIFGSYPFQCRPDVGDLISLRRYGVNQVRMNLRILE